MIKFSCGHCNKSIGAPDKYAGKRVRCPKCQEPTRVPESAVESPAEKPALIKFRCPGCNQKIGLGLEYAGKRVRCAKCEKILRVPQPAGKATEPDVKEDTEPSVTAQQEPSASDDLWAGLENMEALLSAEAQAPSLEMPDRPPVPDYGTGESEFSQFPGQISQYDSSSSRTVASGSSMKKYAAIIIGTGLLVAFVTAIYVWTSISSFMAEQDKRELMFPRAQEVAEKYIRHMENGEIDEAQELLSPEVKNEVQKDQLEAFAKRISDSNMVGLECTMSHSQEHPQGDQFYLFYDLESERNNQSLIVSMIKSDDEFRIESIAIQDYFGNSISLGPSSFEELAAISLGGLFKDIGTIFAKFFCGILLVALILGLVQVASWWIIFERAGYPGWAAIVPFYNMWVLARVGEQSGWVGIGFCFAWCVPVIGSLIQSYLWITLSFGVAKTFNRGFIYGLGLSILPIIFFPILAFTGD